MHWVLLTITSMWDADSPPTERRNNAINPSWRSSNSYNFKARVVFFWQPSIRTLWCWDYVTGEQVRAPVECLKMECECEKTHTQEIHCQQIPVLASITQYIIQQQDCPLTFPFNSSTSRNNPLQDTQKPLSLGFHTTSEPMYKIIQAFLKRCLDSSKKGGLAMQWAERIWKGDQWETSRGRNEPIRRAITALRSLREGCSSIVTKETSESTGFVV